LSEPLGALVAALAGALAGVFVDVLVAVLVDKGEQAANKLPNATKATDRVKRFIILFFS
jgi:hypothetical protein